MSMDITFIEGDPPLTEAEIERNEHLTRREKFLDILKEHPGKWAICPEEFKGDIFQFFIGFNEEWFIEDKRNGDVRYARAVRSKQIAEQWK